MDTSAGEVNVSVPSRDAVVSPFTRPANRAVNVGFAWKAVRVALFGVTVSGAGVTASVPGANVIA